MTRKYLDDIGLPKRHRPDKWRGCDEQQKRWKKQRKKYGFDERETWALNHAFYLWLYERLNMYVEFACIDLDFHKFQIDGQELTQRECIERILDGCKVAITTDIMDMTKQEEAKMEDAAKIWAKILPAMWW